jgi:hypothetical protein
MAAAERPTIITVICVLSFIGAALTIPVLFMGGALALPSWYMPYVALSAVVGLVLTIGLWKMKKWGALGYAGFAALNQVVLLASGMWSITSLIIPGIVVAITLSNLNKMD